MFVLRFHVCFTFLGRNKSLHGPGPLDSLPFWLSSKPPLRLISTLPLLPRDVRGSTSSTEATGNPQSCTLSTLLLPRDVRGSTSSTEATGTRTPQLCPLPISPSSCRVVRSSPTLLRIYHLEEAAHLAYVGAGSVPMGIPQEHALGAHHRHKASSASPRCSS